MPWLQHLVFAIAENQNRQTKHLLCCVALLKEQVLLHPYNRGTFNSQKSSTVRMTFLAVTQVWTPELHSEPSNISISSSLIPLLPPVLVVSGCLLLVSCHRGSASPSCPAPPLVPPLMNSDFCRGEWRRWDAVAGGREDRKRDRGLDQQTRAGEEAESRSGQRTLQKSRRAEQSRRLTAGRKRLRAEEGEHERAHNSDKQLNQLRTRGN